MNAPARADRGRAGHAEPDIVVPVVGVVPVAVGGPAVPRVVVPGAAAQNAKASRDRPGFRLGPCGPARKGDRERDGTRCRERGHGADARYRRARHGRSTIGHAGLARPRRRCRRERSTVTGHVATEPNGERSRARPSRGSLSCADAATAAGRRGRRRSAVALKHRREGVSSPPAKAGGPGRRLRLGAPGFPLSHWAVRGKFIAR